MTCFFFLFISINHKPTIEPFNIFSKQTKEKKKHTQAKKMQKEEIKTRSYPLDELESIQGYGTSLISVYIAAPESIIKTQPKRRQENPKEILKNNENNKAITTKGKRHITMVQDKLNQELKTCENIKDNKAKKLVQRALRMSIQKLTMIKSVPSTGMALFAGQCV